MVQNTANEHSKAMQLWHLDIADKDVSWVIFRTELSVEIYPVLGEEIRISKKNKEIEVFKKNHRIHSCAFGSVYKRQA